MIKIFNANSGSKVHKKRSKKRSKGHSKDLSEAGEKKLSRINPMAFGLLAVKVQESPNNDFLRSSLKVISESPHFLTDKWIESINKLVDSITKAILLDPPEYAEGGRIAFENLFVVKIVDPKDDTEYPMPAIICMDDRGWKFYFKTSKAYDYTAGNIISFTATVSAHKEGITFLRRPSKIRASENLL
jgi:hypothetical protein